jgi:hypothetical protein
VGPLIFNYEALIVKVCLPNKLSQAIYAARFTLASFSEFSQGNSFHVQHVMLPGTQQYAVFHASFPHSIYLTPGDVLAGNYNQLRLLQTPGYPGTEAVMVGTYFLAGIRRRYLMRMSSDSFLLPTEAYERPRGGFNNFAVHHFPSLVGKGAAFHTWDRELLNVAQFTESCTGARMTWGKPINHWATFPGETNELDGPWISSLPQSLQPQPAGGDESGRPHQAIPSWLSISRTRPVASARRVGCVRHAVPLRLERVMNYWSTAARASNRRTRQSASL